MSFCSISKKLHVHQDKRHDTYSIERCLMLVFWFVLNYLSFTLALSLCISPCLSYAHSLSITLLLFFIFSLSISFSYLALIVSRFLFVSPSFSPCTFNITLIIQFLCPRPCKSPYQFNATECCSYGIRLLVSLFSMEFSFNTHMNIPFVYTEF